MKVGIRSIPILKPVIRWYRIWFSIVEMGLRCNMGVSIITFSIKGIINKHSNRKDILLAGRGFRETGWGKADSCSRHLTILAWLAVLFRRYNNQVLIWTPWSVFGLTDSESFICSMFVKFEKSEVWSYQSHMIAAKARAGDVHSLVSTALRSP
jgi:hypothetical protein